MSLEMGRPKKPANRNLPPRMGARRLVNQTPYYYHTRSGRRIPLGPDLALAKIKWAQLEQQGVILRDDSFETAADTYAKQGLIGKSVNTDREYRAALKLLKIVFRGARLGEIRPLHIRQYLTKRTAKVSGNREIAVFSAMCNWARDTGVTDAPNPAAGVKRNRERAREVYVTDEQFQAVYAHADQPLRDALDLARLTGQREADILKMRRNDVLDGHLRVGAHLAKWARTKLEGQNEVSA